MNEGNLLNALPDWNLDLKSVPIDLQSTPTRSFNKVNTESTASLPPLPQQPNAFQEAIFLLVELYRAYGSSLASEEVKKLVDAFSTKIIQMYTKSASESEESFPKLADFSCPVCFEVFNEPHTARCGHSYCKKCLQKEAIGNQCRICSYRFNNVDIAEVRPNVLLQCLADKLWPNSRKTAELRNEGNALFQKQQQEEAMLKYSEAIELSSNDHLSLCNRAHTHLILGDYSKALEDAESAISFCPIWFKSYFRKAVTLVNLGRYEEAFATLSLCIHLIKITNVYDQNALELVKNEMVKALQRVLQTTSSVSPQLPRHKPTDISAFSPYAHPKKNRGKRDRKRSSHSHAWTESGYNSSGDEHDDEGKARSPGKNISSMKEIFNAHHCHSQSHHTERLSIGVPLQDPLLTQMNHIFARSLQEVSSFEKRAPTNQRSISEALVSSSDFECSLCYRLLYQPVTTTCGHTYCRSCLERCLDHSPTCPLCKTSLESCIAYRRHAITYSLDQFISKLLPKEYADRVSQHMEELADGITSGKNKELEIPIFVCTMAFPTVPCMLHVFEPRYRLMIRRCMESGSKRFGMCCYLQEGDHNYGDFGTMLEVRNIQYFPDGRSVCNTVGIRRFKVLKKAVKDGYNVATIEFLEDKRVEEAERPRLREAHETVFKDANEWLQSISSVIRQRIYTHFGTMPSPEEDWINVAEGPSWTWWLLAILPLDAKAQLAILGMSSLQKRLDSLHKVLRYVKTKLS